MKTVAAAIPPLGGWPQCRYRFIRNDVVLFPKRVELEYLLPAGSRWCAIPLSDSFLAQAGSPELKIDGVTVIPGNRPLADMLRQLLGWHRGDCVVGARPPSGHPQAPPRQCW